MKRFLLLLALLTTPALAQGNPAAQGARQWRRQHERAIVDEFVRMLAIPNVTRDRDNIERNADAIARLLSDLIDPRSVISRAANAVKLLAVVSSPPD